MPTDRAALAPPPPLAAIIRPALFLDFDGTLVDLIDRPDQVTVDRELEAILDGLDRVLDGRLAIVSGRSVAQLDTFLGARAVRLLLGGSHGAETRWRDQALAAPGAHPSLARANAEFDDFAAAHPGVLAERKSHGIALHYRQSPSDEALVHAFVRESALVHGFTMQTGKMMAELKTSNADKGAAVRTFMAHRDLEGATAVFLGDDLTDEAGFCAVAEAGGSGLLVGPNRATAARWQLADVAAVRRWLIDGAEALS